MIRESNGMVIIESFTILYFLATAEEEPTTTLPVLLYNAFLSEHINDLDILPDVFLSMLKGILGGWVN